MIEHHGEEAARDWAQGVVEQLRPRAPGAATRTSCAGWLSGECDISVSNTYYFARALRTEVDGLGAEQLEGIGFVFPSMAEGQGAHVNLSGGGVAANAPNRDNAVAFLEYLASDSAQAYFANGNDEYPVVEGVPLSNSVRRLGPLEADAVDLSAVAKNVAAANRIFAEVGWE